ncbi:HAMP domain-containing sensor histidine kinase [soil metagenome]
MKGRSLAFYLVLVAVGSGIVVTLVASLLALPLVKSAAQDQVRSQLVSATEALAAKPVKTANILTRERRALGPDERQFAVVTRRGAISGPASAAVDADDIRVLLDTGTLSTEGTLDGEQVLVEGRKAPRGFAAIAVQPVGPTDEATTALVRRLALALFVGLVVASALGIVLARRIARPVSGSAQTAHRLAAGERGIPVGATSIREVAEMTDALAALDAALASSEGRQREFLLSISHEIRTPLTAMRGYAEALADGTIEPDGASAVGQTLVRETERLDGFVSDLLALARLETDDFTLSPAEVDVSGMFSEVEVAWRAVFLREGIGMQVDAQPDLVVRADSMRLRQLIDGLVENALRATPAGGVVVLRAVHTPQGIDVSVEDNGPGLRDDDAEIAFERGVLRDRYRDLRQVGTGLGLSIARRLSERMGVRLVVGAAPSGGAVFMLSLPAA